MSSSPFLIASLAKLRDEFNTIAPGRDKTSDGWIGDAAHQAERSDHNDDETGNVPIRDADSLHEVHAIDVDRDLRLADVTMEDVVQFLLVRCRSGAETRLRYIIFNRRIWEASNDWRQRAYTGANPHDHHAHFSGKYDSASESNTRSYELEDEFMAIDYDKIRAIVREEVRAAVTTLPQSVWGYPLADPYDNDGSRRQLAAGTWLQYVPSRGQVEAARVEILAALAPKDEDPAPQ